MLINGASPCNVYWQVGSSATLGTTTAFQGNLMALTSISLNNGATVVGRVLARNGQISLINNVLSAAVRHRIHVARPRDTAGSPGRDTRRARDRHRQAAPARPDESGRNGTAQTARRRCGVRRGRPAPTASAPPFTAA